MQKTNKSVAKRFKLTATGKLMRRTPGFRHLLRSKSTKAKRRATRDKLVAPGHAATDIDFNFIHENKNPSRHSRPFLLQRKIAG
jgi:large subunit ribosomal protein L35